MFEKLKSLFSSKKIKDAFDYNKPLNISEELRLSATVLFVELSAADNEISGSEGEMVVQVMSHFFGMTDSEQITKMVTEAVNLAQDKKSIGKYLEIINENCTVQQKISILSMCWRIVMSDQDLAEDEKRLLARIRTQLRLSDEDAKIAEEYAQREIVEE